MFDASKFRWYQYDAIVALWDYFYQYTGNPLVLLPCGTGKSWVIAGFIQTVFMRYPNTRVAMLTHDENLIKQNLDKLLTVWPSAPCGVFSAGMNRKEHLQHITFGGIQSVHRYANAFPAPDLVVIDEAHLIAPKQNTMYRKTLQNWMERNPSLKIIGLSATGYRLGQGMLTDGDGIFDHVCYDMTSLESYNRLVREGFIAPLIGRPMNYEMSAEGIAIRNGDYVPGELEKAANREEVTRKVIEETIWRAQDRKRWLVFATGVDHCDAFALMLNQYGIPTVPVHSKLPGKQADENLEAFKRGDVRAAVNMNSLTTGIDVPEVDLLVITRHTMSTSLWVQMLGRGARPAPWAFKENGLVLDFTTNTKRLGPVNDPNVPAPPKKGKKAKGGAVVKTCPNCGTYNHPSYKYCGNDPNPQHGEGCGYEFPDSFRFTEEVAGLDVQRGDVVEDELRVELLPVKQVTYNYKQARSINKHDTLMVTYYTGETLTPYRKVVCLNHPLGSPAHKHAQKWWRAATGKGAVANVPLNVSAAMHSLGQLRKPSTIRVWMKKPYPQIQDEIYD